MFDHLYIVRQMPFNEIYIRESILYPPPLMNISFRHLIPGTSLIKSKSNAKTKQKIEFFFEIFDEAFSKEPNRHRITQTTRSALSNMFVDCFMYVHCSLFMLQGKKSKKNVKNSLNTEYRRGLFQIFSQEQFYYEIRLMRNQTNSNMDFVISEINSE